MIKQNSIDELRNKADLTDIVNRYTVVKRNDACCPIHEEKTPSFHIYISSQTFKCFGCGESGDVFKLVMKMEKLNFVEAAEWLARELNITLEYDQQSREEAQEVKDKRTEILAVVDYANKRYTTALQQLPADAAAITYLAGRGYDDERIKKWDLGFAPDDWKFITTPLINMGKFQPATECGLVYSGNGKNWDFYRNRITIPIHDQNGILVGIAGRLLPGNDKEADKRQPKYLNPCESLVYNKKKIWYGLWQAQKEIKNCGFAYIVEGYFDVHSMQDHGMLNTVAACGTEVDDNQVKSLKRYTDHVVLSFDGDIPGEKKQMNLIDLFLKHHFKVNVIPFREGQDPDEYIKQLLENPQEAVDTTL